MSMKISLEGIAEIAGHEGIVLEPYLDSVGVWTVGVGHTAHAGAPDPEDMRRRKEKLSIEDALALFDNDLDRFEARVRKHLKNPTQTQFDAGVSFDFNTGAIDSAWWVRAHNAGDFDRAAAQIMNWKTPPEIIPRREKEQALYRDGTYNPAPTPIYTRVKSNGRVDYSQRALIEDAALLRLMGRVPEPTPELEDEPLISPALEAAIRRIVREEIHA